MNPYYEHDGITIYHGDCLEILPGLDPVDLILTDPPYLTGASCVPIRGSGVAERRNETLSVGMPWGYSLDWIYMCNADHYVVFANYRMLGDLCSRIPPQTIFVWRKSNAPRMTRPVPRLDCEFIIWHRSEHGSCERMGEFDSMVIDVPMPQAGCMAKERICINGGKAAHPCQKPLAVTSPFIDRLNAQSILDPFMGSGTTLRAAKNFGRKAIGIDINEEYCEIAVNRLAQEVLL